MKWYRSGKYITLIIQCQKHAPDQFQQVIVCEDFSIWYGIKSIWWIETVPTFWKEEKKCLSNFESQRVANVQTNKQTICNKNELQMRVHVK
jgi:hypothetical protein